MKRICLALFGGFVALAMLNFGQVNTAQAFPTFAKAFLQRYVGEKKSTAQQKLDKEISRVKKCYVCHDPRKDDNGKASKKNRNPYGAALHKYLGKDDKKNLEKALKMLEKVEDSKADGADKTYGELIKSGKVPFEYK